MNEKKIGYTPNAIALDDMIKHLEGRIKTWDAFLMDTENEYWERLHFAEDVDTEEAWKAVDNIGQPRKEVEEMLEAAHIAVKALKEAFNEVEFIEQENMWKA